MMEFYDSRTRKAKKQHLCEMCHKPIKVGEQYSYETGKFEGDFFERKMHLDCFEMFAMMLAEMGENDFSWDDFPDWWIENRCYVCKLRYSLCKPDENCSYSSSECSYKNKHERCTADDDCTELSHLGWCDKFEQEGESNS